MERGESEEVDKHENAQEIFNRQSNYGEDPIRAIGFVEDSHVWNMIPQGSL